MARAVERVEDRTLLAANLHVSSVSLANVSPVDGEQGYGRIDYTTESLPIDAAYEIEYKFDGVPVTLNRTSGAGMTSSSWAWIYGGWILPPGNHTLEITLDASNTIAEYGRTVIGTYLPGSTGVPLTVSLNANANVAAIQALLRATAYSNNTIVRTAPRYVRFTVVDEVGKISNQPVVMVVTEFGAPVVSTLSSIYDATNVGISTNLVVTFNETVVKGTGNILIKKISDNSIVQTIGVTSGAVTISGAVVMIDPANLAGSTGYYIEIAATAFKDLSNDAFAGINGATSWNFTTVNVNDAPTGTVTIDDTTLVADSVEQSRRRRRPGCVYIRMATGGQRGVHNKRDNGGHKLRNVYSGNCGRR